MIRSPLVFLTLKQDVPLFVLLLDIWTLPLTEINICPLKEVNDKLSVENAEKYDPDIVTDEATRPEVVNTPDKVIEFTNEETEEDMEDMFVFKVSILEVFA